MNTLYTRLRTYATLLLTLLALGSASPSFAANPKVAMTTNHGTIELELLETLAPKTVANFLKLVDDGFYDGLIFHRVIANFMIQGGGYTPDLQMRSGAGSVDNESYNGVKNTKGTIAMARMDDPDSADTQFFINVRDNPFLDADGNKAGYTVFGRVIGGMDVVEQIELVNTHLRRHFAALPEETVLIKTIRRIE